MQTLRLRTCLAVPGHTGGSITYGPDVDTIGKLLRFLGDSTGSDLTAPDGTIVTDLDVRVNGKDPCFFPQGLETPIGPEDDIEVYLRPLGGG